MRRINESDISIEKKVINLKQFYLKLDYVNDCKSNSFYKKKNYISVNEFIKTNSCLDYKNIN